MKKVIISIFVALVAVVGFLLIPFKNSTSANISNETYLRIHVRANSNSDEDQQIKYALKDVLVDYLTPILENVETAHQAKIVLNEQLENISNISTDFLKENGFSYSANAKINNEFFPTRSYEDLTLESGYYDALIVELGEAKGNNWWCVVYPPLCFTQKAENGSVQYASIIQEIIERRKAKWWEKLLRF